MAWMVVAVETCVASMQTAVTDDAAAAAAADVDYEIPAAC